MKLGDLLVMFLFFLLQGVLVFWLQSLDSLRMQKKLLSFKILLYMLMVVVGHLYAFPYKEYAGANIAVSYDLTRSLAHALKLNDLYHDTVHQVCLQVFVSSHGFFQKLPVATLMIIKLFAVCTNLS
jgi:hypothetical protein